MYPHTKNGYWTYGTAGFPIVGGIQENLLEGFEDDSLTEYGGDLADFDIQGENVLKGRLSLQSSSSYSIIGDDGTDIPTERTDSATEYQARVYPAGSGDAIFCTNVQSESSPFRDCYAVTVDTDDDELRFYVREANDTNYLERKSLSLTADTEYRPFITLTTEGINGGIRDSGGSLIYRTDSYRETTHTGGGIGWRSGVGAETYFDHCIFVAGSMGELTATLDDFEDGDLSEYTTESSSGTESVVPAAAYAGNYGLELDGFTWDMTTPGDGLDNYIVDGNPFEFYFAPLDTGISQYYMYLCPQSNSSTENTYELEFLMDGLMRIQKDKNGSESTLSGSGTGEPNFAETRGVSWEQGNWYRLEVIIDGTDGKLRAELYDASSGNYIAYVEGVDSEFINPENGFGFFCSSSGNAYFDEVKEV